ncbi:hypothetical protein KSAC_24710 [Komagataeibacter saccharivorans]|nr:hypothetical protein KSAC_24710 [Komagataeibacter saccharivorans]
MRNPPTPERHGRQPPLQRTGPPHPQAPPPHTIPSAAPVPAPASTPSRPGRPAGYGTRPDTPPPPPTVPRPHRSPPRYGAGARRTGWYAPYPHPVAAGRDSRLPPQASRAAPAPHAAENAPRRPIPSPPRSIPQNTGIRPPTHACAGSPAPVRGCLRGPRCENARGIPRIQVVMEIGAVEITCYGHHVHIRETVRVKGSGRPADL